MRQKVRLLSDCCSVGIPQFNFIFIHMFTFKYIAFISSISYFYIL